MTLMLFLLSDRLQTTSQNKLMVISERNGSIMSMAIDWTILFKTYKGMWVALQDDEVTVIVSGKDPKVVKARANKKGFMRPIMMKIPTKLTPYIGTQYATI